MDFVKRITGSLLQRSSVAERVARPGAATRRSALWCTALVAGVAVFGVQAAPPAPSALPTGGQIVGGQGAISQVGAAMTIQQTTPKLATNWQTFNVGAAASVVFVQPSASAVALNRVLSADPSQIYGRLSANGQVFIVNPSGVVFGPGAQVNTAGLVASAMALSTDDFMAGRYVFTGGVGTVENFGQLAAREGGYVVLVGGQVANAGSISAPGGQVALAAGSGARLELGLGGLISVGVDAATAARIQNTGVVDAEGGRVWLTANRAGDALEVAINQQGVVRANTFQNRNGEIWLDGGSGQTRIAGTVQAIGAGAGDKGGKIVATGGSVTLASGSSVDASGAAGGGQVSIGGGWQGKDPAIAEASRVTVESGAKISADATVDGTGGTVVLWSGQATQHDGAISARGAGQGDGGAVETSSRGSLGVTGGVNAGSANGRNGTWLLDPTDVTVNSGAGGRYRTR